MSAISGVYQIKNIVTDDCYIGGSVNVGRRLIRHRYDLNHSKHFNTHLQRSWNKYGRNSFKFNLLLICDRNNTIFYEQIFLDFYQPVYNKAEVAGASMLGKKFSKQHRDNLSKALKGRVITQKARSLISEGNKGNTKWLGKTHTQESKDKMSKYRTGRLLSKETRKKISNKLKGENHPLYGKHHTEEARKKISKNHADVSGKNNPNYGGHPHSEETKQKISEGLRRHYKNKRDQSH